MNNLCEWGHDLCAAPDTECPHWQGTFCELDEYDIKAETKYEAKMRQLHETA